MNRDQFRRALKKFCRDNDKSYDWKPGEGKGSHGTIYVDGTKTIVQSGELPRFYVDAVLRQLGLDKDAL